MHSDELDWDVEEDDEAAGDTISFLSDPVDKPSLMDTFLDNKPQNELEDEIVGAAKGTKVQHLKKLLKQLKGQLEKGGVERVEHPRSVSVRDTLLC